MLADISPSASEPVSRWNDPVRLRELCTPLGVCLALPLGPVPPHILAELRDNGYDQAPVIDADDRVAGVIYRERAQELLKAGRDLTPDDQGFSTASLAHDAPLRAVLDVLSVHRSALISSGTAERPPFARGECVGLITISDLNRHPFRVTLYDLLGELEGELARLIERHFNDPWDWLGRLDEQHQIQLLGYWEFAKRQNIDIGPVAALTLTQMLHILARTKELWQRLGYESRSSFDGASSDVPSLRNKVMHPVRPLVLRTADVAELRESLGHVIDLAVRARSVASNRS
jgi:hypothetical protein